MRKDGEPQYAELLQKLGGRTFVSLLLATLIYFIALIWTYILLTHAMHYGPELITQLSVVNGLSDQLVNQIQTIVTNITSSLDKAFSFLTFLTPWYLGLIAALSGIKTYQKHVLKKLEVNGNSNTAEK